MFEVVVWDYDVTPRSLSRYCVVSCRKFDEKSIALGVAEMEAHRRVGAAVFDEQKNKIAGFGFTFIHPDLEEKEVAL